MKTICYKKDNRTQHMINVGDLKPDMYIQAVHTQEPHYSTPIMLRVVQVIREPNSRIIKFKTHGGASFQLHEQENILVYTP